MDRLTSVDGDVPASSLVRKLDLDDPFYRPSRTPAPEEPSRTQYLARVEPPMGEGGGGGGSAKAKDAPIDEDQEGDNPFAINVKITGRAVGSGDWSTALVEVLSGTYDTYGGTGPFNAAGVAFPGKAYSQTIAKADFMPYVYLAVPLELTSEANGVRASDGKFYRAIAGAIIVLRKQPTEFVWPNVLDPAGSSPPRTAIKIGTWDIARHNTSPGGIATWDLRAVKQNEVSDNIVIGEPYGASDRVSRVAVHAPWALVQQSATSADIKQPLLLTNIVTNTYATVTGATGLALGTNTTYWLSGTFDSSGTPTSWAVTTTPPGASLITFGAGGVQTGAWYPLARVISGSHPQLSGFDFISGGSSYHLEQLCTSRLAIKAVCAGGIGGFYPVPQ